jgi:pheromone shutdown protein TraB
MVMRRRIVFFLAAMATNRMILLSSAMMTVPLPARLDQAIAKGLLVQPRPDVYILGTVHIGSESAEEAEALIQAVQPHTVVVEVPPSRVDRIRQANTNLSNRQEQQQQPSPKQIGGPMAAIRSLPGLAVEGWSKGGWSGLVFSTAIIGSSLIKRSLTANEEIGSLPRRSEFSAAIAAADAIGARVVPADLEVDELIQEVAHACSSPFSWFQLAYQVAAQTLGLVPTDPIRRLPGETMVDWAERRRDIQTARASRHHGEMTAPEMSRVLVNDRDAQFAALCSSAVNKNKTNNNTSKSNSTKSSIRKYQYNDSSEVVVCIIGLVHLDGVVERLEQ